MMSLVPVSGTGLGPDEGGISVEHDGDAVVVRVTGELDLASAPRLEDQVEYLLHANPPPVLVLDLTGVTFLASAGLAVLVRAYRGGGTGTRVGIVADNRATLRPLQMTRLDTELAIFPTARQALTG